MHAYHLYSNRHNHTKIFNGENNKTKENRVILEIIIGDMVVMVFICIISFLLIDHSFNMKGIRITAGRI